MSSCFGAKSRTRLSNFTFTFHFHALEKEIATHSSVPAWRIPGMEEPGFLSLLGPVCLQLKIIQMQKWHILGSYIQLPCITKNFHFPLNLEEAYINREVIFQIAMIVNKYCIPVL